MPSPALVCLGEGDTIAVYLLKDSPDPATATSRTLLYDFRGPGYSNDAAWSNLSGISLPATSDTSYIALQYRTVANWLDARFDNVRVSSITTSIPSTGIKGLNALLYPNPATDRLWIKTDVAFTQTALYDIRGRQIATLSFSKEIDLSLLAPGTYLLLCSTQAGATWQQTFLKR